MHKDAGAAHGYDEAADAVLPPPHERPVDPDEHLWHTESFAAITDEPERRKKLATGLAVLGVSTIALCTFAGVKLASMAGVTPPSPPRYVITEQAQAQAAAAQRRDAAPPPRPLVPAPPRPVVAGPPAPAKPRSTENARSGNDDDKDSNKASKAKKKRKKSD